MGDHQAKNRSSHPPPRANREGLSGWPQSRFLAIGTFGHGQNRVYDHALRSSSGDSSEEELQLASSATATGLSDTINNTSHSIVLEYIRKALKEEYKHIEETEEALSQEKSLTKKEQELQKLMIRMSLEECLHMSTADATHYCSFQERSSWIELVKLARSEEKERYLCISDGFMIYCLDLKSKDDCSGQTLPKTSTLNLLEGGLPVSMGLFKLGSGAYMVSGQELPNFDKLQHPEDRDFLQWLYKKYGFEGSSRRTYHLSGGDGRLSLFECDNIPPLKKPKFWPIVERIGDEIHVIESIPGSFLHPPCTIPSHEVLNLKEVGQGWMELPPLRHPKDETRGLLIINHVVVGDQIYALVDGLRECFVFNCKTNKWEGHGDQQWTKHVGSLLYHGKVICSGQLLTQVSPDHPVYVIIGIVDSDPGDGKGNTIAAVAHLVNKKGEIVSTWELPNLFEGLKRPCMVMEASLFRVEEQGTSICAVVIGSDRVTDRDFLCVSTFTVEQEAAATKPPSPNSVLSPLLPSLFGSDSAGAEPKYYLRPKVVVKGWQVFQLHYPDLGAESADYFPPRLSACFL